MTQQQFNFQSRRERERDQEFLKNYGDIGIAAVLAASAARRKEQALQISRKLHTANHNAHD